MGDGQGKTMAAFGLALRSVGHGHKVIIVQFMKGRKNIGEFMIAERLSPEYEIHQFGREEFMDLSRPTSEDFRLAHEGLRFAQEALSRKPDLLILDEIGLAASIGLVGVGDVEGLVAKAASNTVIVITGRRVPKEIVAAGDLVTEMREVKHPMRSGMGPTEGIEY